MKYLNNEFLAYFDVDDTLIMHDNKRYTHVITDPYNNKIKVKVRVHKRHIDLMKRYKDRGFGIVVWSNGGCQWAKTVVEHLKLTDLVDLVVSKPNKVIDDLQLNEILSSRVYLNETGKLEAVK